MSSIGIWLRWSTRDLRRRWTVVAALAAVIAIGTGSVAAMSSASRWRRLSNDVSYQLLGMHDLLAGFGDQRADPATAVAAVRGIPHARWLRRVEVRLDTATQVELVTAGRRVALPGRLVGVDLADGGPRVDRVRSVAGARLTAPSEAELAGTERPRALLETSFAKRYGLPPSGVVRLAGGAEVAYTGLAQSPLYLVNGLAAFIGEPVQGALFVPLALAQRLAAATNQINQVAVTLVPGADLDVVRREINDALATGLPAAPATVTSRWDDPGYRMLYQDIDNDQKTFTFISLLILAGAALATFNLTNRVVAAQRREFGVGLAIGLRPMALAVRPLLFAVQIAALGALAGIGVGLLLGAMIKGVFADMLPIPQWRTPFQVGLYLRAALLGTCVPLLGIAYPLWRAVRITPADAIRTAHVAGGRGRLAGLLRQVPLPGSTVAHLPVRHLLRAPGRAVLTAAGIGAAITGLVCVLGMLDSMNGAADRGERELTRGPAGRTVVTLDTFYCRDCEPIRAIEAMPEVADAQPALRVPVTASRHGTDLDLVVDVLDFDTAMWTPTLRETAESRMVAGVPQGIVLARKAADDLGVKPGDEIEVRHLRRAPADDPGGAGFVTVTSRVAVAAIHPHPARGLAYLDEGQADRFGLTGMANSVQVRPVDGVGEDQLRLALLTNRAATSVQPVAETSRSMREGINKFVNVIGILVGFVLALTLLIAFNTASIGADERTREHATIFAFGIPIRTVLRNAMTESLLTGLGGTALGLLFGAAATLWTVTNLVATTMPEYGIQATFSTATVLVALALGVVAVTVAPLMTLRRLRALNLPAALRVVE